MSTLPHHVPLCQAGLTEWQQIPQAREPRLLQHKCAQAAAPHTYWESSLLSVAFS